MAEDEEVLRKGSVLYNYLQDNGFADFESYECDSQHTSFLHSSVKPLSTLKVSEKAPQWTTSHLNCILKSGLLLEDHRHFIEQYCPLETEEYSKSKFNIRLCSIPLFCLGGGLWRLAHTPVSKVLLVASAGIGSFYVAYRIKENWKRKYFSSLNAKLKLTISCLEKLFVHYKKMLQLIHQNDFISQNTSFRQRELFEFKRKLYLSLLGAFEVLIRFLEGIKKIPLSVEVNAILQSSFEDMCNDLKIGDEEDCSFENLKKLFNLYILVQSEFLRRFALCHCPDVWNEHTPQKILLFCQNVLPEIMTWSSSVHKYLIQELKLYRAVSESKNKGSQFRAHTSSSWDYADIYVSIRSACVHFQSLLIQTQGLQELLENSYSDQSNHSGELLNAAAQILTEISKEIHLGQVCIDASLAQVFKMSNPCQTSFKPNELEDATLTIEDSEHTFNSACNAPVQDEVFELTVLRDELDWSDDKEWDDTSAEYSLRKKTGETSKKVLEELKTVLVKKAEEWKEREKRAMENKGMPYTAPMQVDSPSQENKPEEPVNITHAEELLDFLPTNSQSNWPLPRLKGSLKTHRSLKCKKHEVESNSLERTMFVNASDREEIVTENSQLGFGGSLLAEAMAKSRAMRKAREEEIFHDSDNESFVE